MGWIRSPLVGLIQKSVPPLGVDQCISVSVLFLNDFLALIQALIQTPVDQLRKTAETWADTLIHGPFGSVYQ